ncbi:MAG TPA: hypothetical protein VHG29_03285 [Novosphingobium sp.]|nr:hypothetical protein [Novosphingobium sp.]
MTLSNGLRGFYTTRHAFGKTREEARSPVLERLTTEFSTGASAQNWQSVPPAMTVEESWQINWFKVLTTANTGSTFYDERP